MSYDMTLYAKGHIIFTLIRGLNAVMEEDIRTRLQSIHGMNYPAFRILWILHFTEKMSITDITVITLSNISNTSRQLGKLRDDGYAKIECGNADSRLKEVSLTKKGRDLVTYILTAHTSEHDFNLLPVLKTIQDHDLEIFIKVASLLTKEIVGTTFVNWAHHTTAALINNEGDRKKVHWDDVKAP
ncbi:hypothetical protein EJF36_06795 [Bacillus sp. HMF5848]|uniref:MarR family winged helix-turn-helix transcriptional regulator n=1 Tax=Bacillus sp. HMF5848 TaxID=2495421 RepID=UPI000F7A4530|nr:hypothetical protein [Bacillus sp. HMF5848]RSK26589.1 hypothetical protein EJF36_06795 [Bacillus sp. HMF5848]